jgi:hypothetical protein
LPHSLYLYHHNEVVAFSQAARILLMSITYFFLVLILSRPGHLRAPAQSNMMHQVDVNRIALASPSLSKNKITSIGYHQLATETVE